MSFRTEANISGNELEGGQNAALVRAPRRLQQPIAPTSDWVLLALAAGPMHGGAIAGQIIEDKLGAYVPSTSLYRILAELVENEFIERVGNDGTYQLTAKGRQRLRLQAGMWERSGRLAQQRLR